MSEQIKRVESIDDLRDVLLEYVKSEPRSMYAIAYEIGIRSNTLYDFLNKSRYIQHKTIVRILTFLKKKNLAVIINTQHERAL